MKKWVIAISTIIVLAIGAFFLIGGLWNYFFGTRIGMMLSPLMMVFGGFIIIIGIIICLKARSFSQGTI